jgi:ABC-type branched-subunit amino acid transport system substrate-binding protein
MSKRFGLIAIVAALASLAIVASAIARPTKVASKSAVTASSAVSCTKPVQIGMMAPITGPVASIGDDQLHWAEFFVNTWNANKENKVKLKLVKTLA